MRNEKLGTDTTALKFDFDAATGYADVEVSVAGTVVNGGLRIYANGTIAPPSLTTVEIAALTGVAGMLVYDETVDKLKVFTDDWETITSAVV